MSLKVRDRPGDQEHSSMTQSYFNAAHAIIAVFEDNKSLESLLETTNDALACLSSE